MKKKNPGRNALFLLFQVIGLILCAQTDTVIMENMSFKPQTLTVNPGTTVVWVNRTNQDHTSTSGKNCTKDGTWNSGYVSEGKSFSYTFKSAGSFDYFCIPHCLSGMKGVIVVSDGKNTALQSDELKKKESERPATVGSPASKINTGFKGLDLINAVTANPLSKGVLDFTLYHRFDDLTGTNGGPQVFFGLDNIRDYRLSLAYGLTKNITLGLARSKGDWFNAPYQIVKDLYDGSVKIRICSQDTGTKFPLSIAVYANSVYTAMKKQDVAGSEANFQHPSDRFSHSVQIIAAHNFKKYLSVQLMPVYLRRNWVNTSAETKTDELDLFSLGGGLRWGFSNRFAILAEYFYVFSDYRQRNREIFSNPLAVGVEFNTGGHIFHINLSNATGIIPNTFIPYTTSSWLKNGFRLGFSISRKFVVTKSARRNK